MKHLVNKNSSGVYEIWIGNSVYVGSSLDIYSRLDVHYNKLKNNKHVNKNLQSKFDSIVDINSIEVKVFKLTKNIFEMRNIEKKRTIELRDIYNVLNIDNGLSRSKQSKDKISNSMKGKYNGGKPKWTEEYLRDKAGIKKYTKTQFMRKFGRRGITLAKKLKIENEIFIETYRNGVLK